MKVTGDTIARTVCLGLALLNQTLAMFGVKTLPFFEDDLYQFITLAFTIISAAVAWWKNNSYTQSALKADEILKELREDERR